jgi:hypothetical protein
VHYQLRDDKLDSKAKPKWHAWIVALLVLGAISVRLYRLHCGSLGIDGAICGLLGLGVLEGRWPLFFYGQDFMGALDGYMAAPIYALFGPGTITLNIWAPILSFLTMLVLYACLRRYLKPLPSLVALAYMSIPPAMALLHAGRPNNHYPVGILLCALLMWFSFKLWEQKPWRSLTAFGWGLMAGLALWTNFQTIVVIWACMLFLILTSLTRLRLGPFLSGLAGAAMGAGPLIYYNLAHKLEHTAQSGSFALKYIAPHWDMMWKIGLPIVLGFNPPEAGGEAAPGTVMFGFYLFVAALMLLGLLILTVRSLKPKDRWALLPVLVVLMSVAVLVTTIYGRELKKWDLRYLLPIYLGLPFVWAGLAQALGRRSKAFIILFGIGLLVLNVSGWEKYGGGRLWCGWKSFRHEVEVDERKFINQLRQAGFNGLYIFDRYVYRLAFYAGEEPQFADPWSDKRLYAAIQVDADPKAGMIDPPKQSVEFLGLQYKILNGRVFYGFQPPQGAETPLPRGDWQFSDVGGANLGRSLVDGDLRTGFSFADKEDLGKGFALDLGSTQTVGGLVLLPPDFRAAPGNLTVEIAGEGEEFKTVRSIENGWQPFYWSAVHPFFKTRYPRVECYFPPQEIRYLRVTHRTPRKVKYPCTIGEVMLLGPSPEKLNNDDWPRSGELVAEQIRAANVKKIYADSWLSAFLKQKLKNHVWCLTSNFHTDDYGGYEPPADQPLFLDTSKGSAMAVPFPEAAQAEAALNLAGIGYNASRAGNFQVFLLNGQPGSKAKALPLASVSSEIDPNVAAELAKGIPSSGRWGSLHPQKPGMSLVIDLGENQEVAKIRLSNPNFPLDYPRSMTISLSDDGITWHPAETTLAAPLVFTGRGLFAVGAGFSEYALNTPLETRFIRLSLNREVKTWWWSLERVEVFAR